MNFKIKEPEFYREWRLKEKRKKMTNAVEENCLQGVSLPRGYIGAGVASDGADFSRVNMADEMFIMGKIDALQKKLGLINQVRRELKCFDLNESLDEVVDDIAKFKIQMKEREAMRENPQPKDVK